MHRAAVLEKVVEAIRQIQEDSGRPVGVIDSSTKPVGGAPGFDSLNGIEATVILSESLDYDIPDDNLFVSEDGRWALTIGTVADKLCVMVGVEAGVR